MNAAPAAPSVPKNLDYSLLQDQVSKFKTPHGVKIGDRLYAIRALFSQYNCAIKFVGRLTPHVFLADGNPIPYVGVDEKKVFDKYKNAIIEEFSNWVVTPGTYPILEANNPFFPGDHGRYLPNALVYADRISKEDQSGYSWFNWFPTFIKELETGKHGWQVIRGVKFRNNTYGTTGPLSQIYTLIPPKFVDYLVK